MSFTVRLIKLKNNWKCFGCGKIIKKGENAISCIGRNEDGYSVNERYHQRKACADEFFIDFKSIGTKAIKMLEMQE